MGVDPCVAAAVQAYQRLLGDYRSAGLACKHSRLRLEVVVVARLEGDSEGQGSNLFAERYFLRMAATLLGVVGYVGGDGMRLRL
jgi:hypothetical protein